MIASSKIGLRPIRGGGGGAAPNPDFVSTWDTTQAGSASDTIVLPMTAGNTVDWGDGTINTLNTHTYAVGGIYIVTISGAITTFRFAGAGDYRKIIDISNWGSFDIASDRIFQNCANLNITATDKPLLSSVNSAVATFRNANLINVDFSGWDFSICTNFTFFVNNGMSGGSISGIIHAGVTTLSQSFKGSILGDQDLSTWVVTNITNWNETFQNANLGANTDVSNWIVQGGLVRTFQGNTLFEGNGLPTWNIVGITSTNNPFSNTNITTVNYDALLVAWEAQAPPNAIGINFGSAQYTIGSAADTARTSLITTYGWTITDGGGI